MSQLRTISINLGTAYAGDLANLRGRLYNTDGSVNVSSINTGFVEVGDQGNFLLTYAFPDDFRGGLEIRDNVTGLPIPNLPLYSLNPEEIIPVSSGARAVSVSVRDSSSLDLLANAAVRFTIGGASYVVNTSASGPVIIGLDDGTYTVTATKDGYEYYSGTLVVNGNETLVIDVDEIAIPPADDPSYTNAYLVTYDKRGEPEGNVLIYFQLIVGPGDAGKSHYSRAFAEVSESNGSLVVKLLRQAQYKAWRGTDPDINKVTFTTTDTDTFQLPEILGYE